MSSRSDWAGFPDWAWAVALVAVGAVVSWFRMDAVGRETLWAEDGTIFLTDALGGAPLGTLLEPYQGYLHLVPRLIAAFVVTVVPVEGYAIAMAAASCIVVGAVAATVFVCAREVVSWRPARIVLGALTFLAPAAAYEVLGNAANLHWYALWLAPWLLLASPRRRTTAVLLGAVGLVAALTEIQMLLFLPLLAWRARDRKRWIIGAGLVVGAVLQVAAYFIAPRDPAASVLPPLRSTVEGYLYHVPMGAVFPTLESKAAWVLLLDWWGAALVMLPFLVASAWVLWRGLVVERIAAIALVVGSVVTWTAAYVLNSNPNYFYSTIPIDRAVHLHLMRYGVVPAMFLLAVVVLAASVARRAEMRRTAIGVLAGVLAVTGVAVVAPAPPDGAGRADATEWADGVTQARLECAAADVPDRSAAIAIAPAGWIMQVSCDRLSR